MTYFAVVQIFSQFLFVCFPYLAIVNFDQRDIDAPCRLFNAAGSMSPPHCCRSAAPSDRLKLID